MKKSAKTAPKKKGASKLKVKVPAKSAPKKGCGSKQCECGPKQEAKPFELKPLDMRVYPLGKGQHDPASRDELRQIGPRINAPHFSNRAIERSHQQRSHYS